MLHTSCIPQRYFGADLSPFFLIFSWMEEQNVFEEWDDVVVFYSKNDNEIIVNNEIKIISIILVMT